MLRERVFHPQGGRTESLSKGHAATDSPTAGGLDPGSSASPTMPWMPGAGSAHGAGLVSLGSSGASKAGGAIRTLALQVHIRLRRGHPAQARAGCGRRSNSHSWMSSGLVLAHYWEAARTSAPEAWLGSPRPAETTRGLAPWTESPAHPTPHISAVSLAEERPVPWKSRHWVGVGQTHVQNQAPHRAGRPWPCQLASLSLFFHL